MMEIENNLTSNGYTPILICASSTSCHFQSAGLFRVSVRYIIVRMSWAYSLLQGVLQKNTHFHNGKQQTRTQRQYMIFTLYISHILVLKRNYWQSQGFPTWDEPHFLPLPGNICKKVYNRHSEGGWEISIHWEIKWINTATNMTSTCLYILALGKSNGGHFGGVG